MNQLPAHLLNRRPSALTQAVSQGLSSGAPPYISIAGNRFTLVDAAGNERPLQTLYADVVIVQANQHVSKVYYDKPFNPSATEYAPPACFSDNGIGPSRQSQKPQSPTCATCPNNVWGSNVSNITGKGTKACNDAKKLAVIMADSPDMPFLLRIPPASLKNLGAYAKTIAAQSAGTRSVEMSDVVTRVSFESQGVLSFEPVGWVDERTAAAMEKIWDAKSADDLVGLNDTPFTGQIGATPLPGAATHPQGQLPPPPQPVTAQPPPAAVVTSVPQAQAASAPAAPPPAPVAARGRGRPKKDAAPLATMPSSPLPPVQSFSTAGYAQQAQSPGTAMPSFFNSAQAGAQQQAMPAPAALAVQAHDEMELPAFLRREQPAAQLPAANQPRFGMVENAAAPNSELDAALARAMSLPLPKG